MTFLSPWAVDGARIKSAVARTSSYAESGGAEGIVSLGDLKVTALAVPGAGFRVAAGAALVLNRYQAAPNQTYTAVNDALATYGSTDMPAVSAGAISHLVCVTIGDPEFSQAGHPWMLSSDPPVGTAETFQYARVFVVPNVPNNTTTFAQLNRSYPALALARIDLPANTATVQTAYIKDLRTVARPRNTEEIFTVNAPVTANDLNGQGGVVGTYEVWPSTATFAVTVPAWAATAKVFAYVEGARKTKAGNAGLRVTLVNSGSTTVTDINEPAPAGAVDREAYNVGGKIDIAAAQRGVATTIRLEGTPKDTASKGTLSTDTFTSAMIRVRFEEAAV